MQFILIGDLSPVILSRFNRFLKWVTQTQRAHSNNSTLRLSVSRLSLQILYQLHRTALIEERNRQIIESYLRAWNTLESIANEHNIDVSNVKKIIAAHFDKSGEMSLDFKPQIYNIWNTQRQNACDGFCFDIFKCDSKLFKTSQ
jgi:hypothetical protein